VLEHLDLGEHPAHPVSRCIWDADPACGGGLQRFANCFGNVIADQDAVRVVHRTRKKQLKSVTKKSTAVS
jgi:hypothetical protein